MGSAINQTSLQTYLKDVEKVELTILSRYILFAA